MKKGKIIFVTVLLLSLVLSSRFVAGTYAKYASEITGNSGTATVAKWAFATDNTAQSLTINLANNNINTSTLDSGKIAPGTSGSFDVQLVNTNTETAVDFTIKLNSITNLPTNLKFYKTYSNSTYSNELTPGTSTITGTLAAKSSTPVTVTIYWVWEFGSSDAVDNSANVADTTAGTAGNQLTIGVDIVGVQHAPGTSLVTSGTN